MRGGKNDGTCKKQRGFRLSVRIYSENCNLGSLGFSANGNDAAPSAIPGMAERGTAAAGEYYHDQGFLFAQEDGKPMHPDSITSWLAKFSKRHGLPHINPHAFRHTMASLLYFNGVDSVSISV